MEHLQANDQEEAANKIILPGMKKKLDDAKGLWDDYHHKILWSYHTTPHSATKETASHMVYEANTKIPVEVDSPTWHRTNFNDEIN